VKLVQAFFMCFGMFTAIPCPWRPWNEDARDSMLVMLPGVGLVIGFVWLALAWLGRWLLPGISAALLAALPWLLTGFIHLDGYMDTCDAILSWRSLEKRLEILKDSHTGAYAVVGLMLLALFSYDAARTVTAQDPLNLRVLLFIPVVSRCGSALSVLSLKPIGHSQYSGMEGRTAQRLAVCAMWLVALALCALWLHGKAVVLLIETLAYAVAMAWAFRTLEGVSGDVAGFALSVSECVALAALAGMGR